MNTLKRTRYALIIILAASLTTISSCGSDDGVDPGDDMGNEISLSFTLNDTNQEAVFNSGSIFLAVSDGSATVLNASGVLASGQNYAFAATFAGTGAGTYTLDKSAGEDNGNTNGMSLAILDGQNTVTYVAKNISLVVTGYTVVSLAQITVTGTFSGTLENEETMEEVTITNGSFTTGSKD